MIAKLRGILDTVGLDWIIIDVQGVGYQVTVSNRTIACLPEVGSPLSLHIVTLVRQELTYLVGFLNWEERETFEKLIVVQGVGAKVALAILSALPPEELALAIHHQDKAQILRADGVGPKLAARLLTELKDKITITNQALLTQSSKRGELVADKTISSGISDVFSALENLGYKRSETASAVAKAIEQHGPDADVSQLIRTSLGLLSLKLTGKL